MLKASVKTTTCISAVVAESLAIREATRYARQQGFQQVIIESNSLIAINEINQSDGEGTKWEVIAILDEIWKLSREMGSVRFYFANRKRNKVCT